MIDVACPTCGYTLAVDDHEAGRSVTCPSCQRACAVPAAAREDHAFPTRGRGLEGYRMSAPVSRCSNCGAAEKPIIATRISTAGWVVFALLLLFCLPLFWIGLLIRESYPQCPECGASMQ